MLGQRCRRWANISPTLGHRLVFAGFLYTCFVSDGRAEEWDYIRSFKYCYNRLMILNFASLFPTIYYFVRVSVLLLLNTYFNSQIDTSNICHCCFVVLGLNIVL